MRRFSWSVSSKASILIWVIDGACLHLSCDVLRATSASASSSSGHGCWHGCRDRASAASFVEPLIHLAVKLYCNRRVLKRCRRGFSISSSRCVFRMAISGWWSTMTMKWSIPARNVLHFLTAHATARHSSSITA